MSDYAPAVAEYPLTVAVVDQNHGIMLLSEFGDLVQRRDVTVHAEHAVGDNQLPLAPRVLPEYLLECGHVVVLVHGPRRLGQPHAVDYRAVVQFVGDDYVLGAAHEGGDEAYVGGVSRGVNECRFDLLEASTHALGFEVEVQSAGYSAYRARAGAVLPSGLHGCPDDLGVGG